MLLFRKNVLIIKIQTVRYKWLAKLPKIISGPLTSSSASVSKCISSSCVLLFIYVQMLNVRSVKHGMFGPRHRSAIRGWSVVFVSDAVRWPARVYFRRTTPPPPQSVIGDPPDAVMISRRLSASFTAAVRPSGARNKSTPLLVRSGAVRSVGVRPSVRGRSGGGNNPGNTRGAPQRTVNFRPRTGARQNVKATFSDAQTAMRCCEVFKYLSI